MELKAQLQRLSSFDRAKLPFDDAIDAQALEGQIRSELLDIETLRIWEHNPMRLRGDRGLRGQRPDHARFRAQARAAAFASSERLKSIPAICAAGKANVQNPPKEFTTLAIRMAKGSAGFLQGTVAAWAKDAAGADAALLARVHGGQR